MRSHEEIHKQPYPSWHFLPLTLFIIINGGILFLFHPFITFSEFITPLNLIVFGLATYRIADIIANEQVTKVIRVPFVDVKKTENQEEEVPKPHGIKNTLGTLFYCPSCVGVWAAAFLLYGYIFWPQYFSFIVIIFCLSGLERAFFSLIQAWKKWGE